MVSLVKKIEYAWAGAIWILEQTLEKSEPATCVNWEDPEC